MRIKSIGIFLLCIVMIVGLVGCGSERASNEENTQETTEEKIEMEDGKNYTVMIYMVGSNLESEGAAASRDILEMVESGIDTDINNVIIYTGGSKMWYIDGINSMTNSVIKLEKDGNIQRVAETSERKNMGESATLSEFINYCYENYKANHYGLICWNHGAGPIGGFGSDELYNNDSLFSIEMKEALDSTPFSSGEKLEFIGFDACLMASIEYVDMLSKYANYMVASQEVEPGYGWDYSFLNVLNSCADPKEVATRIIDSYKNYYETQSDTFNHPDITLSCIDLSKAVDAVSALDNLFEKMSEDISDDTYIPLATGRNNTKSYGLSATGGKGNSLDLIDLGDFAEKMSGEYGEEAEKLKDAVSQIVTYQASNVEGTSGVSLYYPYDNKAYFKTIGQYLCGVGNSNAYTEYMSRFVDLWMNNSGEASGQSGKIETGEDEYTYQLTKKQQKNLKKVTYTILEKGDSVYHPIYAECQVTPDENGVIHIKKNQEIFYIETADKSIPWEVVQISDNGKEKVWKTSRTRVIDYAGEYEGLVNADIEDIEITFVEKEDGVIEIKSVTMPYSDTEQSGKNDIDITKWYGMYNYYGAMSYVTKDKKGKILPYSQWKSPSSGAMGSQTLPLQSGFKIKRKLISENEYNKQYVYQIVIEDVKGELHATELKKLESDIVYEEYTEQHDNTKMNYRIYSNYAELISVESEEKEIDVPDTVKGVKVTKITDMSGAKEVKKVTLPENVTVIGERAFYGLSKLIEIHLPKSLEKIGMNAFSQCERLRKITLPSNLKVIAEGAFSDTNISELKLPKSVEDIGGGAFGTNVEKITLEDGNENYEIKDGVLFTKGLKKLIYYPHKEILYDKESRVKTIRYEIPKGVEEIGEQAFACEQLAEIKFPETLKKIDGGAFRNCGFLKEIILPDSLETICSGAFLGSFRSEVKIYIGKSVNYIGREAFGLNYISEYSVSEENPYYSTLDGNLTNKTQDTLLFSKTKSGKLFRVPEGIKAIGKNALDGIGREYTEEDFVEKIVIPDSVEYINYWVSLDCKTWTVGKGLQYWDCAERINKYNSENEEKVNVSISTDNPYYKVKNEKIVEK